MNRLTMYRLLRRNVKLSEKRNPALDESKVAKVMMYIGAVVMAIYMIFIGSIFGKLAAEEDEPGILLGRKKPAAVGRGIEKGLRIA